MKVVIITKALVRLAEYNALILIKKEVIDVNKLTNIEMAAVLLTVVGGLNWLLVGLFSFDAVALLGDFLARVVYVVVGVSALYVFTFGPKLRKESSSAKTV